VELHLH